MRGMYTAGVLDFFLQEKMHFPYLIGVSAGAIMGSSYVSRQPGRIRNVILTYINDPRYLSLRNFLREGNIFSLDFGYNEIPYKLIPFDFDAYAKNPCRFIMGATDCQTGRPIYFEKNESEPLTVTAATAAMPVVSKTIHYRGYTLLDGGISDPIPLDRALADGCQKPVLILTRPKAYRRTPSRFAKYLNLFYPQYPHLVESLVTRAERYNALVERINRWEEEKRIFVLRPETISIGRLEKNVKKLDAVYRQGFTDAQRQYRTLQDWLAV